MYNFRGRSGFRRGQNRIQQGRCFVRIDGHVGEREPEFGARDISCAFGLLRSLQALSVTIDRPGHRQIVSLGLTDREPHVGAVEAVLRPNALESQSGLALSVVEHALVRVGLRESRVNNSLGV